MGIAEILFIVFLVLKLIGAIAWSWWWVTAPLWITYGAWLIASTLLVILTAVTGKALRR